MYTFNLLIQLKFAVFFKSVKIANSVLSQINLHLIIHLTGV